MPLIQSRKYEHIQQYVSMETWKEMQEKGLDRRYKIVPGGDSDIQDTIIKRPEIFDFEKKDYDDITKSEIIEYLEARGIDYPAGGTKKELYELYL